MKAGDTLPIDDHVLRYISPRHIDEGLVQGAGFWLRPQETASSVNWLEYFKGDLETQVQAVRNAAQINYAKTGQLVRVSIEKAATLLPELSFIYDPLEKDPSHSLIYGLPIAQTHEATLTLDLLRLCITHSFATRALVGGI